MKRILLLAGLPLFLFAEVPSENLKWVDEQITAIKPSRTGMGQHDTAMLKNPFATALFLNQPPVAEDENKTSKPVQASKKIEKVSGQPNLQAIVNKSSVLIDGNWYKKDDKVYGYMITEINETTVVLKSRKKELKLFIAAADSKIKIQTK